MVDRYTGAPAVHAHDGSVNRPVVRNVTVAPDEAAPTDMATANHLCEAVVFVA